MHIIILIPDYTMIYNISNKVYIDESVKKETIESINNHNHNVY